MKACSKCGVYKPLDDFYDSTYVRADGTRGKSSWCKFCHVARSTERTRERRATDEGRAAHNEWSRKAARRAKLLRHGVPSTDVEWLILAAESGICHACGRPPSALAIPNPSARRLHVDHDHKTNQYRGLLCQPCNSALGLVEDDIERLQALIAYLQRPAPYEDMELMK